MIGGAPFFQSHLETALLAAGIELVYAFSRRPNFSRPACGRPVSTEKCGRDPAAPGSRRCS
jgi:hypothetical protein